MLVTGHRGRVGAPIVAALERSGVTVVGFDRLDGQDVLDGPSVDAATAGVEAVVHLAARREGSGSAAAVLATNVLGTWNVLAAAARHGVERVVVMSSVRALGADPRWARPRQLPLVDAGLRAPVGPYEWSKLLGEELSRRFARSTGIPSVCLRPPAVVSSADIDAQRAARRERPVREWEAGWWFGAFVHADDLAAAVVAALTARLDGHRALLVGGPDVASAVPTAELAARFLPEAALRPPGGDLFWPTLDTEPASSLLGWAPVRAWGRDESESLAARAALRWDALRPPRSRRGRRPDPRAELAVRVGAGAPVRLSGVAAPSRRDRLAWAAVPDLWGSGPGGGPVPFAEVPARDALAERPARRPAASATAGRRVVRVVGRRAGRLAEEGRWRWTARRARVPGPGATLRELAVVAEADLRARVLPSWYDTAQDGVHGGYLLGRHPWRDLRPVGKQLISQSRMVWGFSLASRLGLGSGGRDYLAAAAQGCDFLLSHFLDPVHGGCWWTTLLDGTPSDRRKVLSGQAFAVYALAEHARAGGDPGALDAAVGILDVVERELRDPVHGGWREQALEDWGVAPVADPLAPGRPDRKTGDAHLHAMEAWTQLLAVTGAGPGADAVAAALRHAVDVNARWFFPGDPSAMVPVRALDGSAVDGTGRTRSFGHDVEFAWLLQPALRTLGRPPDLGLLARYVDLALQDGWDRRHGGLFDGLGPSGARSRRKSWWTQAELLAALATLVAGGAATVAHEHALHDVVSFVWRSQRDPRDGMWLTALGPRNQPLDASTATEWKAAYHDVRAMVTLVAACGDGWPAQERHGPGAPGAPPRVAGTQGD